jgi:hypothetical protein
LPHLSELQNTPENRHFLDIPPTNPPTDFSDFDLSMSPIC